MAWRVFVTAWVLTDRANPAAMRLYNAAGGSEAHVPAIMFEFSLRDRDEIRAHCAHECSTNRR